MPPSAAWKYFDKTETGAACKIVGCDRPLVVSTGASTTPLWSHLESHHKTIHANVESLKQPPKRKRMEAPVTSPEIIKTKTEIAEDEIMKMLARLNAPFTTVDDPLFKRMMTKTFPDMKVRGSRYFARTVLPRLAAEVLKGLRSKIGDRQFAITTDGWSAFQKPKPAFYR